MDVFFSLHQKVVFRGDPRTFSQDCYFFLNLDFLDFFFLVRPGPMEESRGVPFLALCSPNPLKVFSLNATLFTISLDLSGL